MRTIGAMTAIPHPAPSGTFVADTARALGATDAFDPNPADDLGSLDAAVATFARDVVAPGAPLWERERRIGREAIEAAAARGLCRIEVPAAHGGLGLPFSAKPHIAETLAGADFGFAFSLINTGNIATKLACETSPERADRWVPALMAGRASMVGTLRHAAACVSALFSGGGYLIVSISTAICIGSAVHLDAELGQASFRIYAALLVLRAFWAGSPACVAIMRPCTRR
jgi:hypothetical protein